MEYIHYGSRVYDPDRVKTIRNSPHWVKPNGGLWASAVDAKYGWKQWCEAENFRDCSEENSFRFSISSNARVLHLRNSSDLKVLPKQENNLGSGVCLDFEKLIQQGYDAVEVHISDDPGDGRYCLYYSLYGWDCDSIVIMNKEIIELK